MNKKFAALLSGAVATGAVMASTPVFAAQSLSQGYQVAAADQKTPEGSCGGNAKSQEDSCGANAKSQEGSHGSNAKSKEGSCGAEKGNKPAKTEKPTKASKGMEGRCGEGKCGGNRKMK